MVFGALLLYLALGPSLYMACPINPVTWVLPPSHFTEDNTEAQRDRGTCAGSQSECAVKIGVTPVPRILTTRRYGLVLAFAWEACKILNSTTEGCAHGFTLPGQYREVLRQAAGLGAERAVGEGPAGAWEDPAGPAGFPHCHHCSRSTRCLRTNPLTQTLNNCLIWPAE